MITIPTKYTYLRTQASDIVAEEKKAWVKKLKSENATLVTSRVLCARTLIPLSKITHHVTNKFLTLRTRFLPVGPCPGRLIGECARSKEEAFARIREIGHREKQICCAPGQFLSRFTQYICGHGLKLFPLRLLLP